MKIAEDQLTKLLSEYPQIKLALLFGSQVSGKPGFDSDIDLALLADRPIDAQLKLDLIKNIGKEFGRAVDIVDLAYGAEPIMGQALKGKRLIGSDTDYAGVLTRHLFNVADFMPLQERTLRERRDAWIK